MPGARITTLTRHDRALALVKIEEPGRPPVEIEMNADDLEEAIFALSEARAGLLPAVPDRLEAGDRITAAVNWRWQVEPYKLPTGRIVSLAQPGYGWLTYLMSDEQAAVLAEWLVKDLPERSGST